MDKGPVSDAQRVVRFLVDNARCGECGSAYHAEDVYVLDQVNKRVWELAAVCPGCLSVWLVKAVVRTSDVPADDDGGGVRIAARSRSITELTPAEERHFSSLSPIGVDDVLDVSQFLAGFDGDFWAYFGQESDSP